MPDFANPFSQNVPGNKLTINELVRALRIDVAAEEEATAIYEAHAEATDNPLAKKVLLDIANEERVHVGEFIELIEILTNSEKAWMENGAYEVREMAEEVAMGDLELATPEDKRAEESGASASADNSPTVGSLRS